ncbi:MULTISPECIES: TraB/GumN family protein [unclassified Neptuniibacter]|uniref:TraB/GumN family protein n=1 Tax=unclassified Neptuniibacter TaxID=2630693 RepID=UPI000C4D0E4C|nr:MULTISPECIES: TraB/GumN family protein [unclassified Neptuniibacter]MAY42444.1 TraB/GumN family protein [Oceanospirillaceae bacterium]
MKLCLMIFSLLFSGYTLAETFVWKVSKSDQFLFLAGTVHVLAKKDLPFPRAFDDAYEQSHTVVLETDMGALEDPQVQVRLMSQLSYQDGRLLSELISPALYADLNQYLAQRGMLPNMFIAMKPAGVMMTMLAVEFQRLGISQAGADSVYYQKTINQGKATLALESIETHLSFIQKMGEGNEEQFLRQTLNDVEKTEAMMSSIVLHWKSGDTSSLEKLVVDDMRLNYPNMYQSLLVERNKRWLPQIEQMLLTDEVEFVLVGAAHVIGADGLLKSLVELGYKVEQQ